MKTKTIRERKKQIYPLESLTHRILDPFPKVSSLYIHIPFCMRKCFYCDFFSVPYDESSAHAYTDALCRELYLKSKSAHRLKTVYIGGGTPSLLPDTCFRQIFSCLNDNFQISHDAEISAEANPATLNQAKADLLLSLGVNRMSLGVQSFNDNELKVIGRIHTEDEALRSLELIRNSGLHNFSVDLMYGIPGQSTASWRETIFKAVECSPMHISTYELTLEEGTPLYSLIKLPSNKQLSCKVAKGQDCHSGLAGIFLRENGFPTSGNDTKKTIDHPYSKPYLHNLLPVTIPDEDVVLAMYNHAIDYLASHGYKQYEISNFALPGFQCFHNLNYWDRGGYIGAGAGAHTFINGIRSHNVKDIHNYIERLNDNLIPETESIRISPAETLKEFLFLGLRKTNGINISKAKNLGLDIISACRELVKTGYLEVEDDSLRLTRKGIVISNSINIGLFENLGL